MKNKNGNVIKWKSCDSIQSADMEVAKLLKYTWYTLGTLPSPVLALFATRSRHTHTQTADKDVDMHESNMAN